MRENAITSTEEWQPDGLNIAEIHPPPTPAGPSSIHVLRDRNFVLNNHCTINYLCCFAYFVYYRGKPACYLNKYGVKEGWLGKMLPQNYTSTEQ